MKGRRNESAVLALYLAIQAMTSHAAHMVQ